jgi:hypothetical protein
MKSWIEAFSIIDYISVGIAHGGDAERLQEHRSMKAYTINSALSA